MIIATEFASTILSELQSLGVSNLDRRDDDELSIIYFKSPTTKKNCSVVFYNQPLTFGYSYVSVEWLGDVSQWSSLKGYKHFLNFIDNFNKNKEMKKSGIKLELYGGSMSISHFKIAPSPSDLSMLKGKGVLFIVDFLEFMIDEYAPKLNKVFDKIIDKN
jgi:hypothetical protein